VSARDGLSCVAGVVGTIDRRARTTGLASTLDVGRSLVVTQSRVRPHASSSGTGPDLPSEPGEQRVQAELVGSICVELRQLSGSAGKDRERAGGQSCESSAAGGPGGVDGEARRLCQRVPSGIADRRAVHGQRIGRVESLGDEHAEQLFYRSQGRGSIERLKAEKSKRGGACDREVAQGNRESPARLGPLVAELELVQRFQQPIADRAEQNFATLEVVIEGHGLNAKRSTEAPHAESVGSLAFDQRHRAVEDQIPVQPSPWRSIRSWR